MYSYEPLIRNIVEKSPPFIHAIILLAFSTVPDHKRPEEQSDHSLHCLLQEAVPIRRINSVIKISSIDKLIRHTQLT